MAGNSEKVIYNITLQSDEDDEVKVIDRSTTAFHSYSHSFKITFLLVQFQYE
jgi:hypothetical protein